MAAEKMGHGHEGHEGHKSLNAKWIEKARKLLLAVGVGFITINALPIVLCVATGLAMPGYLATAGGIAAASEFYRSEDGGHGGDHGGHGGHGGH